jgi:hypothetical protein
MMALDGAPERNPRLPWCRACRQVIEPEERVARIYFQTDPDGAQGLTGIYHEPCGRRFQSLARVVNMNPGSAF